MSESKPKRSWFARLLGVAVLLLMLWPIGHGWLVRTYAISPWKLFGIAMYCTSQVATFEALVPQQRSDGNVQLAAVSKEAFNRPELRFEYSAYTNKRSQIGLLAGPPDKLAQATMKAYPNLGDILFRMRTYRLSTESATMQEILRCTYHYRKSGEEVTLVDSIVQRDFDENK